MKTPEELLQIIEATIEGGIRGYPGYEFGDYEAELEKHAIRDLFDAINAAGWQVVPRVATDEMIAAAAAPREPYAYSKLYRDMLAAAPKVRP